MEGGTFDQSKSFLPSEAGFELRVQQHPVGLTRDVRVIGPSRTDFFAHREHQTKRETRIGRRFMSIGILTYRLEKFLHFRRTYSNQ